MLSRRRIRSQLYYGVAMLFIVVVILSLAGFQGVLKFRTLTKNIRGRLSELPLAAELSYKVSDLRSTFSKSSSPANIEPTINNIFDDRGLEQASFQMDLNRCFSALEQYKNQLRENVISDPRIADTTEEKLSIARIERRMERIYDLSHDDSWLFNAGKRFELSEQIDDLQAEVASLPTHLKNRVEQFADQARAEYRLSLTICATMCLIASCLICIMARRFHRRIFQPLEKLVAGSRRVASGDYAHRVSLNTNDEMSELADSFNAVTRNFQEIQRDLNNQVKQRTKEVVRSEQMASVGFLAAGVAHEINNPLAAIAWSAESLEMRVHDILNPENQFSDEQRDEEIDEMKKYLRRIQDEAFRCKGITGALLDYSRLGDATKTSTELGELIEGVVEMVSPLGKYREKKVVFSKRQVVNAVVNAQEVKQVVLNLVTNALDSVSANGQVTIELLEKSNQAEIVVRDDGCGMSEEVLEHLFEPFFTRREDGQGTGLGLSITYRIIHEHGGDIKPSSDGVGRGSRFVVTLPLVSHETRTSNAA